MHKSGRIRLAAIGLSVAGAVAASSAGAGVSTSHRMHPPSRRVILAELAQDNAANLNNASASIEAEALKSGALKVAPDYHQPAKILMASIYALISDARQHDASRRPQDTRSIMGPVPWVLQHRLKHHQHHVRLLRTRSLRDFRHSIRDRGSYGLGIRHKAFGTFPAPYLRHDGIYVDPQVQPTTTPTIAEVALRAALQKLGQPYVWAAAGPSTFDCSGLVQWAYAHAGIRLIHYTGSQWNQGRLIPPMDILPGDLILFGDPIHHVGMYLGAGWMINAPYTGQWVDVVPVDPDVAGVVRP